MADREALGPTGARLHLIGTFLLRADSVDLLLPVRAQRLVALLAVSARPRDRLTLASVLFPDLPPQRATAKVRAALWYVRRTAPGLVDVRGQTLSLRPSTWVDLREAVDRARSILDTDDAEVSAADLDLLRSDLLYDWDDEWLIVERERFRQLRLHALEAFALHSCHPGTYWAAIEAGMAAVDADPLRESAQRALINAYLSEGNVHQALRQYESFAVIAGDLGVTPSPELTTLINRHR